MGFAPPAAEPAKPKKEKEAPELFQGLELYLMAFMELTSCRALGHGAIGPIPWLALQRYSEVFELHGEQREDLFYFVQRMDKAYLDWQTEEAEKARKAAEQAAKAKGKGK